MISAVPLSLIFFQIYEFIWPSMEKKLLRMGISDSFIYLLISLVCFACCCIYEILLACLVIIWQGADFETELKLKFSDGLSQVCHVGLGVGGALLGILAKELPLRNMYEWLHSVYPIYFYSIGLVNLLVMMRLNEFVALDPLKYSYWLVIGVSTPFFLFSLASYLVVIFSGNVNKKEEDIHDYSQFSMSGYQSIERLMDLLVVLPKAENNELINSDLDSCYFVVHAKRDGEEGFCHADRPCRPNCFRWAIVCVDLLEVPEWLLTKLEKILEKQDENPVTVQLAIDYSAVVGRIPCYGGKPADAWIAYVQYELATEFSGEPDSPDMFGFGRLFQSDY